MFSFKVEIWLVAWSQTAFSVFFFSSKMLQLQNPVYDLLYLTFNWNTVMKPYKFALGETNGQTLLTPTMSSEFRILSAADRCELLNQYSAERESDPIAADTWWFSKSWIKLRLWAESLLDSRKWALIARQCQIPSAARRSARSRPSALEYISTVSSLSAVWVLWCFHAGGVFAAAASSFDSGSGTSLLVPLRHSSVS